MATELILISSSPPPHNHGLTTPPKAFPAVGVPSTSSPAPVEELIISRHFPSSKTATSTRNKLAALATAYASGPNIDVAPECLRRNPNENVTDEDEGGRQATNKVSPQQMNSAAIVEPLKKDKTSAIRRKRSKLTATTETTTDVSKAGVALGSHWRANKRGAQWKPEDDGDSVLDQSHALYMMHFQPNMFYSDATDYSTVLNNVEQARQNLEFVMDDLTADIAEYLSALADVQRVEAEAAEAGAQHANSSAATKSKRKRRSLKDTKDKDIARALRAEGRKQRAAAKKAETLSLPKTTKTAVKRQSKKSGKEAETEEPVVAQPKACRRKRDWTPPHDSFIDIDAVFEEQAANEEGASTSFSGIVQGFAHEDQNARASAEVTPAIATEKAPKKRGRPKKSDAPQTTADKPAKTPAKSALPKKPKTVTGMALEAYQPAEAETPSDNRISHFFRQVAKDAKKVRSRSPDKKVPTVSEQTVPTNPDEEATKTPAPKAKPRKSVKIAKEPEAIRPKLLSPVTAARRMSDQDFVFGTSSQLVREEDAEGLQDIQQALRESFLSAAPPEIESQIVSRTERGLWHVAGEQEVEQELLDDLVRSRFVPEEKAKRARLITPPVGDSGLIENQLIHPVSSPPVLDQLLTENMCSGEAVATTDANSTVDHEFQDIDEVTEGTVGDITQLMTPAKSVEDMYTNLSDIITSPTADQQQHDQPAAIVIPSSPDIPLQALARGTPARVHDAATLSRASSRPRLSLSPPPYRPALRDLSTNTSPRKPRMISPMKLPASTAPPIETPKRPRGRPRKNSIGLTGSAPVQAKANVTPTKSKLKLRQSPSAQVNVDGTEAWTNIDDIEDSEPDLMPSPPRGSQTRELPTAKFDDHQTDGITTAATTLTRSTPAAKRALSPRATKAKSYGLAKKETSEAGWAATAALLFPQIARTIKTNREPADPDGKYVDCGRKTAKRATKGASAGKEASSTGTTTTTMPIRLSWYEKMLMYDPIVIEDLTDFLVAKGVTVPVSVDSVKERTASKAKAKDAEPVARTLEPWMVQRWCEDHSICCLWRASLVGGTRARY